jgi:long-chain acyl-CoA synthetase
VDAILQARGGAAGVRPSLPGWDAVLAAGPDDPSVLNALRTSKVITLGWFLLGKMAAVFLRIFFDLRVTGKEKLPKSGPFILSPNHQSFLDGPVVASQIPWRLFKDMFYVGTSEIFSQGFFKHLGRTFSLVPVDPDSNLVNAMRAGAYGLKEGKNLVLYPEGERSIDGTPKKFKKGAAILAAHLKVPIYPVAIEGFYEAWPRNRKLPRLAKLRVHFGDPVEPPATIQNPEETYKDMTEKLRTRIVGMWEALREKSAPSQAAAGE